MSKFQVILFETENGASPKGNSVDQWLCKEDTKDSTCTDSAGKGQKKRFYRKEGI